MPQVRAEQERTLHDSTPKPGFLRRLELPTDGLTGGSVNWRAGTNGVAHEEAERDHDVTSAAALANAKHMDVEQATGHILRGGDVGSHSSEVKEVVVPINRRRDSSTSSPLLAAAGRFVAVAMPLPMPGGGAAQSSTASGAAGGSAGRSADRDSADVQAGGSRDKRISNQTQQQAPAAAPQQQVLPASQAVLSLHQQALQVLQQQPPLQQQQQQHPAVAQSSLPPAALQFLQQHHFQQQLQIQQQQQQLQLLEQQRRAQLAAESFAQSDPHKLMDQQQSPSDSAGMLIGTGQFMLASLLCLCML